MLFFTGITRNSGTVLGEQKQNINQRFNQLDELVSSVDKAYKDILECNLDEWGFALDKAWKTKKSLANKITNNEIDEMYDKAIKAGALGGKILGAGGGGFLLVYAPVEKHKEIEANLKEYRKVDFQFENQGSRIIFSD